MVPPPQPRSSLPPPGTVMGDRYRLTRLVAAGGMGAVFEAHDEQGDRAVALKLLHPELTADRDVRRRFRRESSVLMALDHPCIVDVLDVGASDDELLFSVMELLQGETLQQLLGREGPLSPGALLPIVEGIAAGLGAAHDHGVIHGDLKPANVFLVGPERAVKLLDFGLSKVLGLERLTRTGELIGTPAYMAPELLTGKGELDERIDTYAFGVMIYECLTGGPPFTGNVPGKLMMDIVMGNTPPLEEAAPGVSETMSAVVMTAMSRHRERRFHSAQALARAFRDAA
ncbi:MAG: serine/threonine protein kinase [Sandaracinaceae bacterium]|nr:serine/threonine protein kinase [Sandaracinaceae bacterium]